MRFNSVEVRRAHTRRAQRLTQHMRLLAWYDAYIKSKSDAHNVKDVLWQVSLSVGFVGIVLILINSDGVIVGDTWMYLLMFAGVLACGLLQGYYTAQNEVHTKQQVARAVQIREDIAQRDPVAAHLYTAATTSHKNIVV